VIEYRLIFEHVSPATAWQTNGQNFEPEKNTGLQSLIPGRGKRKMEWR
jgi:hypothetical protein